MVVAGSSIRPQTVHKPSPTSRYHLGMASIRKRTPEDGGGYQVRYRDPNGRARAKSFKRKVDDVRT